MSKTFRNFGDAILHQNFFDTKDGSIVDVDYIRVFSNGVWLRYAKHAFEFSAFHQRKLIISEDGTERRLRDVIWIWSGNATLGKNGEAFVPVGEGEFKDVHDLFRHSNQDDYDFTTVTKVWRHPLYKDDPRKGEFFQIAGEDFPVAGNESESFIVR